MRRLLRPRERRRRNSDPNLIRRDLFCSFYSGVKPRCFLTERVRTERDGQNGAIHTTTTRTQATTTTTGEEEQQQQVLERTRYIHYLLQNKKPTDNNATVR